MGVKGKSSCRGDGGHSFPRKRGWLGVFGVEGAGAREEERMGRVLFIQMKGTNRWGIL